MNLKFTNAQWDNAEKISFTLDVQDLDKEFLNGEVFPFTHVIGNDDSVIAIEVEKAYKDLDISDFAPVLPTFEEVQQTKLSDLVTKALAFEEHVNTDMYFISSVTVIENDVEKNLIVNGDRRTRSNIQDLITYQPTDTVTYRDYENIERQLTKEQLQVMLKELCVNGQLLYEQKWAFEDKINACTTIEELNAIEIKFTMHDFSKEEVVADE